MMYDIIIIIYGIPAITRRALAFLGSVAGHVQAFQRPRAKSIGAPPRFCDTSPLLALPWLKMLVSSGP